MQNLVKFEHVAVERLNVKARAFWWGGPRTGAARGLVEHVIAEPGDSERAHPAHQESAQNKHNSSHQSFNHQI